MLCVPPQSLVYLPAFQPPGNARNASPSEFRGFSRWQCYPWLYPKRCPTVPLPFHSWVSFHVSIINKNFRYLVAYFLYNMVIVSVASIFTGMVMKLHRKGRFGKEPPEWVLKLCVLKKELTVKKITHPFPPNHRLTKNGNNIVQLIGPTFDHHSLISTTESNDISTHHYVKGRCLSQFSGPGRVSVDRSAF